MATFWDILDNRYAGQTPTFNKMEELLNEFVGDGDPAELF